MENYFSSCNTFLWVVLSFQALIDLYEDGLFKNTEYTLNSKKCSFPGIYYQRATKILHASQRILGSIYKTNAFLINTYERDTKVYIPLKYSRLRNLLWIPFRCFRIN